MKPRICRCCGEPIREKGNRFSRNPNVCASCSSMADGMEDSTESQVKESAPPPDPKADHPLPRNRPFPARK